MKNTATERTRTGLAAPVDASFLRRQRRRLEEMRERAGMLASGTRAGLREGRAAALPQSDGHLADAASEDWELASSLGALCRETSSIREIEAALRRMQEGTYGLCETTGRPIPRARLEALPCARTTVEAQAAAEKAAAGLGRILESSDWLADGDGDPEEDDLADDEDREEETAEDGEETAGGDDAQAEDEGSGDEDDAG